ncbi:hypothetical protein EXS74_01115 [Candidatus Woesearchaeota archaeon]|nr:hypothetical protein [Candidatus Woesearchaeota archaeon]
MKKDCFSCHGKWYTQPMSCGHSFCPIYTKLPQMKTIRLEKENFVGTAPSVFVGRYGYPNLNVGILAPPETVEKDGELYDAPKEWSSRGFQIQDVLDFRSVLINSRMQAPVKAAHKYIEITQEVAMASKPVDVEFFLQKKPTYQISTSNVETMLGAHAQLKRAVLTSNPHIDSRVDKVVSDNDLKASEAITTLYKKGFDETFLTRILSVGNLGLKTQRKLVPTRWGITATDDIIGKKLIEEIKDYKVTDYSLFFDGYLGNYFLVLFFPRIWSYELFEMYMPSTLLNPDEEVKFTTDHELYDGRKGYVSETAGGYYACRMGILEKLQSLKRQGSIVVLRFITDEYTTPLGVWVVREATRKALEKGREFASEDEMISYVKQFILQRLHFDISPLLKQSKILNYIHTQKTLFDFSSK